MDLGIPGMENIVPVGQGGSAVVYRCRQVNLDRTVAVKVLRESWDEASKKRFDSERRAMGRLSEDVGIVPIYESDETAHGDPYFVMPYYENGSLQGRIDSFGAVEWTEAVGLIEAVAVTISKAHAADIIHRDIKPANLLVDNGGRPLVGDFGIARIASDLSGATTQSAYFTPAFSPPELFTASGTTHPTVDVYGLGATLWSLLAGAPPFIVPNETVSSVTLLSRVVNEPVGDLRASVPAQICDVVEQAMAKSPEDRHQTVDDFLFALRRSRGIVEGTIHSPEEFEEPLDFYAEQTAQFESIGESIPDPAPSVPVGERAGLALKPSWAVSTGGGTSSAVAAIQQAERGDFDAPKTESSHPSRNAWLAIAAASAVLVGLVGLLVWQNSRSDETDGSTPNEAASGNRAGSPVENDLPEDSIFTDATEVVELEGADSSGSNPFTLPDSFASAQRSVYNGSDLAAPLKVQTSVSDLTSTSATVWAYSDTCALAQFTSNNGIFVSPGWPSMDECQNVYQQTLTGLEPGRPYLFSINIYSESAKPVRVLVEFLTPTDDNSPLMIEGLRLDRVGSDVVGISFTTTNCSVIKVERPSDSFRDDDWPYAAPETCRTEHSYDATSLDSNSIFDLGVSAIDESGQLVHVGITAATEPVDGDPPEIVDERVEKLTDSTAKVSFETDVCSTPTLVLDDGRVVLLVGQGCQTMHSYVMTQLEPGQEYEVQVTARNDSGEAEVKTVTFTA